jgi:hypothetical protein
MVLTKLKTIRDILYDLLLDTHDNGGEPAQGGRKIAQHCVAALREVDVLEAEYAAKFLEGPDYRDRPQEVKRLEAPEEDKVEEAMAEAPVDYEPTIGVALKALCTELVSAGYSLQEGAHVIKYGMAVAVLVRFESNVDKAAEALGIKPSYLKALRGRVPDIIKEAADG